MEGKNYIVETKELIQELMQSETLANVPEIIEKLFSETIENVKGKIGNESERVQAEESVVSLWNWTVTRKTGPVISDMHKVKLRHVACRLMMCCEVNDPPEEMIRRQILMAMKTGKSWLDVGKPALADEFLEIALNNLEKLYAHLIKRSTSEAAVRKHKADVEQDLFKVLTYQAESAVAQGDFQKAVTCVQRCKDILLRLPQVTCYLSLLCYNLGVETYELKSYEQSSFWLSQSYEIGKMDKKYSTGQEMQAKVLRLLATVYLEWDYKQHQDKALRTVTLANKENLHPAGFYLKIKILLKSDASDEDVGTAVDEVLQHEFPLDICLNIAKLLLEHEREVIGFGFLKSVAQLFEGSRDVARVIVLHIELLLQRMKEPLAKKMIEDLLQGHNAGRPLPSEILNCLHIILWDRAAKHYEVKSYSEALWWYSSSLNFSSGPMDQNLAKLHRNMAACYLHLKLLEKAIEAVKEAERCDPNSIFTQFYVCKIAILENNCPQALEAIVAMGNSAALPGHHKDKLISDGTMASNLLSLAAQIALENNQQSVAIKALEYLSHHLQDCQQVFTALKCLIRLILSKGTVEPDEERTKMESLRRHLTEAHQRLTTETLQGQTETLLNMRVREAHWFRKIAWNLAAQCESCPRTMRDFFVMSFKFSQFCPPDKAALLAQRTCLLMAAAVDLDISRSSLLPAEQTESLTQALQHIQSCKDIWKVLRQTDDFSKDPTDTLLLLYEFEARTKLNDPSVGRLLDLPDMEIKTLQTMAALAMEAPAHYPTLCKRALTRVLTLLKQQETPDTVSVSRCLHSLVHLSLPSGLTEADARVLEEAWIYFEDALTVMGSTVLEPYPDVEKLWLMTRAWNTGISQYSVGRYKAAEQWCGLAMRFLGHLGTLKSSYESQMIGLYSEVLDKLDGTKGFLP